MLGHFKKNNEMGDILEKLKERKGILAVEFQENIKYLTVKFLPYRGKTESLKEGNFKTYGNVRILEGQEIPSNMVRTISDAYKIFEKMAVDLLK